MRVKTEAIQFKADQKLIHFIEKKLDKLQRYFDQIIDVRVTLKLENSGQVRDKIAEVKLSIPGTLIVASGTQKTFEAAIDRTVDNLKRQLRKYKGKRYSRKK